MVKTYLIQPALWVGVIAAFRWLPDYRPLVRSTKKRISSCSAWYGFCPGISLYPRWVVFRLRKKLLFVYSPRYYRKHLLCRRHAYRHGVEPRLAGRPFRQETRFPGDHFRHPFICFNFLPLSQITGFRFQIESTNQVISIWLPLLAENLVAGMLVMTAGAGASLAYRGLLALSGGCAPFCPISIGRLRASLAR